MYQPPPGQISTTVSDGRDAEEGERLIGVAVAVAGDVGGRARRRGDRRLQRVPMRRRERAAGRWDQAAPASRGGEKKRGRETGGSSTLSLDASAGLMGQRR